MYIPLRSYLENEEEYGGEDEEDLGSSVNSSSPLKSREPVSARKESGSIVISFGSSSGLTTSKIEDFSSPRKRINIFNQQPVQVRDDIESPLIMNNEKKQTNSSNGGGGATRGISGPMAFPPDPSISASSALSMVEVDQPVGFWTRLFGPTPPSSRTITLEGTIIMV